MGNFFNDLNKMVNTIQKVDKMLTEKPKRQRIKYVSVNLTEDELYMIYNWFLESEEQLNINCDNCLISKEKLNEHIKLYDKLRDKRYKFK